MVKDSLTLIPSHIKIHRDIRSASFAVEMDPKSEKCVNLYSHYISMGAEVHRLSTFWTHLWTKGCWPEMIVLHNRLSLSAKPWVSIIYWTIWCLLVPQHSILLDLFTIGFNGKTLAVWKHLATTVHSFYNQIRLCSGIRHLPWSLWAYGWDNMRFTASSSIQ